MRFAFGGDLENNKEPVLMIINFIGNANILPLKNNTAYVGEDEVLLQDGIKYLV